MPSRRRTQAQRSEESLRAFREALERSVTISRERLQEVVDDAVERGRLTRDDGNELVSTVLTRGRAQTKDMLRDLDRAVRQAGRDVTTRARRAQDEVKKRLR